MTSRKPKPYHHGNLRRALVETAARLMSEYGVAQVSLREVARAAEVSHAAPYHHFHDKAALLAAVAEEGFRRFNASQARAIRKVVTPLEGLEELGKAYIRFAVRNPHYFRVMFRPEVARPEKYPALADIAKGSFDRLVATVQSCLSGEPLGTADALPLSVAAWSMVHGFATLWLDSSLPKRQFKDRNLEDALMDVTRSLRRSFSRVGGVRLT